ncbi:hypothetical protein FIBSPDRAFT_995090 [Athelia psychrophila]|uniref:BHLH domain-containing protein n=1 Tax=Athelia psychrophila TaxID=1759441 RepID=A0A165XIL2_9AGAM|nr:hypothetical protein FIBSPDRAFT_995090 [Fibularhizoctonia sp. CBS 109695]
MSHVSDLQRGERRKSNDYALIAVYAKLAKLATRNIIPDYDANCKWHCCCAKAIMLFKTILPDIRGGDSGLNGENIERMWSEHNRRTNGESKLAFTIATSQRIWKHILIVYAKTDRPILALAAFSSSQLDDTVAGGRNDLVYSSVNSIFHRWSFPYVHSTSSIHWRSLAIRLRALQLSQFETMTPGMADTMSETGYTDVGDKSGEGGGKVIAGNGIIGGPAIIARRLLSARGRCGWDAYYSDDQMRSLKLSQKTSPRRNLVITWLQLPMYHENQIVPGQLHKRKVPHQAVTKDIVKFATKNPGDHLAAIANLHKHNLKVPQAVTKDVVKFTIKKPGDHLAAIANVPRDDTISHRNGQHYLFPLSLLSLSPLTAFTFHPESQALYDAQYLTLKCSFPFHLWSFHDSYQEVDEDDDCQPAITSATDMHRETIRCQRRYRRLKDVLPVSNQKSSKVSLLDCAITHVKYFELTVS